MENRTRNKGIVLRVTEEEKGMIDRRWKELGFTDRNSYLRKVAIDTNVLILDLKPIMILAREHNKIGTNINQIAKKVNTENTINQKELDDIKSFLKKIEKDIKFIYKKLLQVKYQDDINKLDEGD